MNKKSLTMLMLGALLAAMQVDAEVALGEINITLKGNIINTTCVVDADYDNQTIDLGSWPAQQLHPAGATSQPQEIVISLINCPLRVPTSISFFGNSVGDGLLALNDRSTATNVALQLRNERQAPLPLGQPGLEWEPLSDGRVVHGFWVNFIALTDNVTPGRVAADATFVINYP